MPIGLYLHIPFCASKCPYCDFYSLVSTPAQWDAYTDALCATIHTWAARTEAVADTLYLGGGTPSLLGGERLARIVTTARQAFRIDDSAEITLEANPADDLPRTLAAFAKAGGNRVSLGMQDVEDARLHTLGRRHTVKDSAAAVRAAHDAGITNISLDLMLGTPDQTETAVRTAAARCAEWGATHVSAYLLKLEPATPFAQNPPPLPDEDATVALYHAAAEALEHHGYHQYEISNFARNGYHSRHNTKYWNLDPYLGIGPSAHSFYDGKRFAYPRSLPAFLDGGEPKAECADPTAIAENSPEEYAMLRLRLTAGLREEEYRARFNSPIPPVWRERAASLPPSLVVCDGDGIRLTRDGFLVSNTILYHILDDFS